jgi:2-polyprenyl-3-methyl-5-hydroxy-6-metoxy-1,4-benzoquinol methylase
MNPSDTYRKDGAIRVLVAIASYGTGNDKYLAQLIDEYRAMPFEVDIVVLSNLPKALPPHVEVVTVDLRGKNPWSLPFSHKQIFAERLNDYDVFIYSEDDTLITEKNIRAFLRVSKTIPENEIPGFLHFERGPDGETNHPGVHGHFHWDPESVHSAGEHKFAFFTNEHSACYMLTRGQLQRAINSGGFLVGPHQGKYDLLCSAATDPYTQCGFQKQVCISNLEEFLVHHLPNKYVGSTFGVNGTELRRQVDVLLRIGNNGHRPAPLFQTETKLRDASFSKNYYEPVMPEIVSAIPSSARSVLAIGCGWGATEAALAEKGLQVVAIPLDPVIPGGAEAKGIEMIYGDFREAREKLEGKRFDCLLLSNVLHLVPDPIAVLASFRSLLSDEGVVVFLTPNVMQLSSYRRKARRDEGFQDLGNYEKTGIQRSSLNTLRKWCREAGMKTETVIKILPPRWGSIGRLALGLLDPILASEFIVVAKRA